MLSNWTFLEQTVIKGNIFENLSKAVAQHSVHTSYVEGAGDELRGSGGQPLLGS